MVYCRSWSGGLQTPFILTELDVYAKSLPVMRDVEAAQVGQLAKVDYGPAQGGLWRGAVMKLGMAMAEKPLGPSDFPP